MENTFLPTDDRNASLSAVAYPVKYCKENTFLPTDDRNASLINLLAL